MATCEYRGIKFSDDDVINLDAFIPKGEYNPHNVRPFLLHDHGFVLCVVFSDSLQDALDEAVDAGKLDSFMIAHPGNTPGAIPGHAEIWDYVEESTENHAFPIGDDGKRYDWIDSVSFLGNASEPFDIEGLDFLELPIPGASFCAQFNARD